MKKIEKFISSTVEYHDIYKAVQTANELKVGLEISRFGRLRELDENFYETLKKYEDAIKDLEGNLTLHGFFSTLCPVSKDEGIREISVKRYYQSLEIASCLGAKTVVFHTCFNNLLKQQVYRDNFFHNSVEFFNELIPDFEKCGITATIENVHEPDFEMIRNIIAAVNSPNLRATVDIGHCNLHSVIPIEDWIKNYGIMLHHMHFHNNFKDEDAHGSLKKGTVDVKKVLLALKEMQIYPQITFEIFEREALFESVKYLEELQKEIDY
ncbi:MAG: sugar phosphate isomerase/epimerase [Candidatus Gastranaerophilales bacterium]|nr:sugar phosphate isomerase/epimerase [Candidatus Gastranaerophilales bacterium]